MRERDIPREFEFEEQMTLLELDQASIELCNANIRYNEALIARLALIAKIRGRDV